MKQRKNIAITLNEFLNEFSSLYELTFYDVVFHTSDSSDVIYFGIDKDKAFDEYKSFDDIPTKWVNRTDLSVEIKSCTNKYKFIYELDTEYETIEDYPIEDYYDDSSIYKLVDEGESELIDSRIIEPINKNSEMLLDEVSSYYKNKYGEYKYNNINVYDGDERKGRIQLRISDHTENINNIDRYGSSDCYISVVICDFDVTKQRFGMSNAFERRSNEYEIQFQSDDDFNSVIEVIENQIEECKERIISNKK